MCGIYGFVSDGENGPSIVTLMDMAFQTEKRGPHAFGFAWLDKGGALKCYKQAGRITENLKLMEMMHDAVMVIGHCRWTTHGHQSDNINNHPHPSDGGWIVHNGIVDNWESLKRRFSLPMNSECDSEVLARLIENSPESGVLGRTAEAVELVPAECSMAMAGLWKPGELVIVKRGRPLSAARHAKGGLYFASLPKGLPDGARAWADCTATKFIRTEAGVKRFRTKLTRPDSEKYWETKAG